ncbi:MAG TPA: HAD-IG family 5'-nucleotidase [Thermoanaerobaculaceae bacterium]|nr:HAD-IG family 5'-nucleotidase [Thermoanaerobaculaceae bacterium]
MENRPDPSSSPPPARRIYCNRTLNMRAIRAIGYDMDYTLVHYRMEPWERRAFDYLKARLGAQGIPTSGLEFDPDLVTRGLIIDTELGNLVKANRFGYVTRAFHGTTPVEFEHQRATYGRTLVSLSEPRYVFLNTLFSLSEACMYAQLVDSLDRQGVPGVLGYADLYGRVRKEMDEAHLEGELKADIAAAPDAYIERDPDLALALLDQREAGKRLMVITNSDWEYTDRMMSHALGPHPPGGAAWRDLFDLVIVSARKPDFFTQRMPTFEVVSPDGLLRPCPGGIRAPGVYVGGDARQLEEHLGVAAEEILYVGDHIFVDVHVSKAVMRWRTALILRELEPELAALGEFRAQEHELAGLMDEKAGLEFALSQARLQLQRLQNAYGPRPATAPQALREGTVSLRARLAALDDRIAPLARHAGELSNRNWGLLMRAGNDKSHLARQVERYADIYTSRVSNFLFETPFVYLRAPRGSLPHDDARVLS